MTCRKILFLELPRNISLLRVSLNLVPLHLQYASWEVAPPSVRVFPWLDADRCEGKCIVPHGERL